MQADTHYDYIINMLTLKFSAGMLTSCKIIFYKYSEYSQLAGL